VSGSARRAPIAVSPRSSVPILARMPAALTRSTERLYREISCSGVTVGPVAGSIDGSGSMLRASGPRGCCEVQAFAARAVSRTIRSFGRIQGRLTGDYGEGTTQRPACAWSGPGGVGEQIGSGGDDP
jgi:hypothetical protein